MPIRIECQKLNPKIYGLTINKISVVTQPIMISAYFFAHKQIILQNKAYIPMNINNLPKKKDKIRQFNPIVSKI